MSTRFRIFVWIALPLIAGVFLSNAPASAQESPDSGFGPDTQVVNIPFSAFHAMTPAIFDYSVGYCCADGYIRSNTGTDGFAILESPLTAGLVPNGAAITQIAAYVQDTTNLVDENIRISLCRTWVDSNDGANPAGDCPVVMNTTGDPGDTGIMANLSGDPLQVLYRTDIDGDTVQEVVNYNLVAEFGIGTRLRAYFGTELKLRQVRILFKRQVSPPPVTATFNDVPTSHPFFQFVEALADSNITAGCSAAPPLYCPDAPLTRGQMAVFLAKALGLSWTYD